MFLTAQAVSKLRVETVAFSSSDPATPSGQTFPQIADQVVMSLVVANPDSIAHQVEVFLLDASLNPVLLASVPLDVPVSPTDETAVDVLSSLPTTFVSGLVVPGGFSLGFRTCEAVVSGSQIASLVYGYS